MYCKGCISFNFSIFFMIYTKYRKKNYTPLPQKKIQFFFYNLHDLPQKKNYTYLPQKKITRLDDFFVHDLHFIHLCQVHSFRISPSDFLCGKCGARNIQSGRCCMRRMSMTATLRSVLRHPYLRMAFATLSMVDVLFFGAGSQLMTSATENGHCRSFSMPPPLLCYTCPTLHNTLAAPPGHTSASVLALFIPFDSSPRLHLPLTQRLLPPP